ncbi:MAG TPA: TolC family protein [Chitinophagaceae bacterium]|nr:TolC family protein [Chitinophagaceae bacterium]
MKLFFLWCITFLGEVAYAQRIQQVPDSLRKKPDVSNRVAETSRQVEDNEQEIKNRLVRLALKNPVFTSDDAAIEIAVLNRKKANSSWLNTVSIGGNINEFVINNSPAGVFYPKYNLGLFVPLDIYSRNKNERKVGDQNIIIANAAKDQRINEIKAETLTRYENYKEQKELVNLEKVSVDNNYSDYLAAQTNYADGSVTVDVLNKIYQGYILEQFKLVTLKKQLNVAIIQLEEIIGIPLSKALPNVP